MRETKQRRRKIEGGREEGMEMVSTLVRTGERYCT